MGYIDKHIYLIELLREVTGSEFLLPFIGQLVENIVSTRCFSFLTYFSIFKLLKLDYYLFPPPISPKLLLLKVLMI